LRAFRGGRYTAPALMADTPDRNDAWGGVAAGWAVTGEMLASLLVCGSIGYLIDRLVWGSWVARVATPIGMAFGAVLGIYLIWLRFGREQDDKRG
jgi:F0F1-type ATP synthase assembly protein I